LQNRQRMYDRTLGYLLIAPAAVVIFGVVGFPFVNALFLSFTHKVVGSQAQFTGFGNYFEIFSDPEYWKVLKNTLIFTLTTVAFKLVFGLILAVVLNEPFFGRSVIRMLLLIPWALSGMVAAMTWKWMFDDTYGIINALLLGWGIVQAPVPWLSGVNMALISVIIVNIWRGIPFFMFSLLGGLQTIDKGMYEAARMDGAGPIRQFFFITVPSIMPVILISTLLSTIWTFNDFENIYLITGGGPLHASAVISTYTYEVAFMQNDFGKATAVAASIIPLLILLIFFSTRKMDRDHEGR
jgi:multiple sugar transport system permease protein